MNPKIGWISLLFLLVASSSYPEDLVLKGVTLIDGTGAAPRPGTSVVIRGERIASILSSETGESGGTVLDLTGMYLLPGLIDSHSHLETTDGAVRALHSGVTTIRVLGDRYLQSLGVRDLVRAGHIPGPEMICAGPLIRPKPGIAFYVAFPQFGRFIDGELRGAENVSAVARAVLAKGVDLVKVGASERAGLASTDPRRQEWNYDEIRAAVEEAAKDGKFVAAHAHAESGIEDAVRAGVRTIEHGTYMNDRTMKMMKEEGTYLVPTLAIMSPMGDPSTDSADDIALQIRTLHMQTALREVVRKAKVMGIVMTAGTDGSYGSGEETARVRVQHDMEQMIECGFSPMEAIVAATRDGARLLGIESRTGTVAPGMEADLIVLDRNPLEDFRVMYEPLVVVSNGEIALNRIY